MSPDSDDRQTHRHTDKKDYVILNKFKNLAIEN